MSVWQDLFVEVARTRYSSLVAYGILLTSNRTESEDLVQDAMVKVFARVRALPNAAAADQYVRRTMYTLFLDETRRRATVLEKRAAVAGAGASADRTDAVAAATDVRAALALLSPQERACIVLRYFDDLTVPQIADVLGIAEGTIKRYLSDAHTRLSNALAPGHGPAAREEGGAHAGTV